MGIMVSILERTDRPYFVMYLEWILSDFNNRLSANCENRKYDDVTAGPWRHPPTSEYASG